MPQHSEVDFAALAEFLDEIGASEQIFSNALSDLPADQLRYADVADVRARIAGLGHLPILSVAESPGVLHLWPVFEIGLKSATEDTYYVLKVRRLLGRFSVTELRKETFSARAAGGGGAGWDRIDKENSGRRKP